MAETDEEPKELTGIEVGTVGLVGRAANMQKYLIIKEERGMEGDVDKTLTELQNVEEVNKDAWTRLIGTLKDLFKAGTAKQGDKAQRAEQCLRMLGDFKDDPDFKDVVAALNGLVKAEGKPEDEYGYPEPEKKKKALEDPKIAELEKAQADQKTALEKAQAELTEVRKANRILELKEIVKGLPIAPEDAYEQEVKLGAEGAGKILEAMRSLAKQVETGKLFEEKGTSKPAPGSVEEFAKGKEKEGVPFSKSFEEYIKANPGAYDEWRAKVTGASKGG